MSNPNEKLLIAAANGNLKQVAEALKNGANIDSKDLNGYTALHCSVYNNKVLVVKYLASQGANVLVKDTHAYVGFTPLHYASAFGSLEMVKALLESKEKEIHCKNSTGQTPLEVASSSEIKTLLSNDIKVRCGQQQKVVENKIEKEVIQHVVKEEVEKEKVDGSSDNCKQRSSCCKKFKGIKKVFMIIVAIVFFGLPAFQLFTSPYSFPYYIFSCGLIIYVGGLKGIKCKCKKDEKVKEKKCLMIHAWTTLCFNSLMLLTNLLTTRFPFFFYILMLTSLPLAIHHLVRKSKKKENFNLGFAIHSLFFFSFVLVEYVSFCIFNPYSKSFTSYLIHFVPVAAWAVVYVIHAMKLKKKWKIKVSLEKDDVENQSTNNNNSNVIVEEENVSLKDNNVVEQVKKESTSTIYPQVL